MAFKTLLYRWRVRSALIVLVAVLALAKPRPWSIAAGAVLCAAGLGLRAWASGHIRKEKELAVTGPYRFTRNPLYLGSFVLGWGLALGAGSPWALALFAFYFAVFYPLTIIEESERMKRLFPESYPDYAVLVPLFFPCRRPIPSSDGRRWSSALYARNREHRAVAGAIAVWAYYLIRMGLG